MPYWLVADKNRLNVIKMNTCRYEDFEEVVYIPPLMIDAMKDKTHELHDKVQDAINVFHWQRRNDKYRLTRDPFDEITYEFYIWGSSVTSNKNFIYYTHRGMFDRHYCIFSSDDDFMLAMNMVNADYLVKYQWSWKYDDKNIGYEVTSKGDRRYSPFFQKVKDYKDPNKLIVAEDYFKLYLKPYYEKGEVPPVRGHQLMENYMYDHPGLLLELAIIGREANFTDMFDRDGGQNKWYAEMLNKWYGL